MISIVVARAKNGIIGNNNSMPWYYPEDLKHFRKITLDGTVLMGRKTFDSILQRNGQPLPRRQHLVVTRNPDFNYPGVEVIRDLKAFLEKEHQEEIFVIGGGEIYHQALPYASKLYITEIDREYDGDISFPEIDAKQFQLVEKNIKNELAFCLYERIEKC